MVGEAHLVGEANIFNVKYIIHECGLPTICRPPPGRHLLGRYTYTSLQHFFRTSPASLRNVRREKEKVEQIGRYRYQPNNSITSLPDSSANKSPTRPLQSTSIHIPTSSCTYKYCLFLRRNRRRRCGTVVRKCCSSSLPASATRRRLGFLRNGSARPKKSTVSIHDACVDIVSLGVDGAQQ